MSEYFQNLTYTLSNEDSRVEFLLCRDSLDAILAVGGSGSRVLPLLARDPKRLDIVDRSVEQLALIELRIAAAKALSRDEFLFFMGYRGGLPDDSTADADRGALLGRMPLTDATRRFWLDRERAWKPRGFIFLGRWEAHFLKLSRIFRDVLRIDARPIFEAHSLEEQAELFRQQFNPLVLRAFVRIAASEFVFSRFLYKGDQNAVSPPPAAFIEQEFTRLFTRTLVRKNYFLQLLFFGAILHEEGLPLETRADVLALVRHASSDIHYRHDDLVTVLRERPYDFISMSDALSSLSDREAQAVLKSLAREMRPGSRLAARSFLKRPNLGSLVTLPPSAPANARSSWRRLESEESWARDLDTTGVYQFDLFEHL